MGRDEEAPGAWRAPEAKDLDDNKKDEANRPGHCSSTSGERAQQQDSADCLFDEHGGSDLLDAGLKAIARAWKIFPCNTQKKPLVKWREAATTDPATITSWTKWKLVSMWARAFPEDVLVIDLDRKHGKDGVREFERLQGCHPDQFDAPRVITATAGIHVYTDPVGRDFKTV
jgi:Bifunctional DNA primase/polymerase, N-terminal